MCGLCSSEYLIYVRSVFYEYLICMVCVLSAPDMCGLCSVST